MQFPSRIIVSSDDILDETGGTADQAESVSASDLGLRNVRRKLAPDPSTIHGRLSPCAHSSLIPHSLNTTEPAPKHFMVSLGDAENRCVHTSRDSGVAGTSAMISRRRRRGSKAEDTAVKVRIRPVVANPNEDIIPKAEEGLIAEDPHVLPKPPDREGLPHAERILEEARGANGPDNQDDRRGILSRTVIRAYDVSPLESREYGYYYGYYGGLAFLR